MRTTFRASYESHMRAMFERHLQQDYPPHTHEHLRAVFNCLHNYQLFHHAAAQLTDVPLPNLVKQRVPGGNVQVFQDIPGGNIQVTHTTGELGQPHTVVFAELLGSNL